MDNLFSSEIRNFLESEGIYYELYDFYREKKLFLENLREGLISDNVKMHQFPSFLEVKDSIPKNDNVIVIDAGGTNLRISALHFNESGEAEYLLRKRYPMPGSREKINAEFFYDFLAGELSEFTVYSKKIGFCFSFATEIFPDMDGKPLSLSKEVFIDGLSDTFLGAGLKTALMKKKGTEVKTVILNDTVAALLGGMAKTANRGCSSYLGFILGTGTNTAYIEKSENILKVKGLKPGSRMIMNTESGTYPIRNRSAVDISLDQKSQFPGDHLFEKMFSGRYQGPLYLETLKAGAGRGIFSEKCSKRIIECEELSGMDLSDFGKAPEKSGAISCFSESESDRSKLLEILINQERRAARLICVNLGAITEQTASGKIPEAPICCSIDGSTYYKSSFIRMYTEIECEHFIKKEMGYNIKLCEAGDSNQIGTALAALMNI